MCQIAVVGAVEIPVVACGGAVAPAADGSPAEGAKGDSTCPSRSELHGGSAIGRACSVPATYCTDTSCDPCAPSFGSPRCVAGTCTLCGGASPACPDGG